MKLTLKNFTLHNMKQLGVKNMSLPVTYPSHNCEGSSSHENTTCHHSTGHTIKYRKKRRGKSNS
jgi:hypothetical protein